MNTPNGIFGTYRLVNEAIRPGDSPEDKLVKIVPVTGLAGTPGAPTGSATVNVPFQPGTQIAYCLLYQATVVANANGINQIVIDPAQAVANAAGLTAAEDTPIGAMIIGGALNLQVPTPFV